MPTPSKRFLMVALDSSIAMIPCPGATMAWAVSASCSMLIGHPEERGKPMIIASTLRSEFVKPASEHPQPLGLSIRAHLQQAQGVGRAVMFHVVAAGEDQALALLEEGGLEQLLHRTARGIARCQPTAVELDRHHPAHQRHLPPGAG